MESEPEPVIAEGIEQFGMAFSSWLRYEGLGDPDDALDRFQEAFIGTFDNEKALGEYLADEMGVEEILDETRNRLPGLGIYIVFDSEAYVHDLDCGGEIYMVERDYEIDAFWTR